MMQNDNTLQLYRVELVSATDMIAQAGDTKLTARRCNDESQVWHVTSYQREYGGMWRQDKPSWDYSGTISKLKASLRHDLRQAAAPAKSSSPLTQYSECAACSGELEEHGELHGVAICSECEAVHGETNEVFQIINLSEFSEGDIPADRTRYFDITLYDQRYRCHGWFDPLTKKVTQFG